MEFGFTETQEALYRAAEVFARETLAVDTPMQRADWSRCGVQGVLGLCIDASFGGQGHGPVTTARVLEGLGYGAGSGGRAFALGAHLLAVCKPIEHFRSHDGHDALLRQLVAGDRVGAFATTEPGAGSDVSAIKTVAEVTPNGYRLTGTKAFITNAPDADVFLVTSRTDSRRGTAGLTAFLVPRDSPGLTVGARHPMMGLAGASIAEVHLDGCEVSTSCRLGDEGAGGQVIQLAMGWERALVLAPELGIMQRQLEATVEHARTREQSGKRIGAYQGVSHRIARMSIRLESARLLLYRGAWAIGSGREATRAAAISKVVVSEAAAETHLDALRVFGASGYARGGGVDGRLQDALGGLIYSGTTEIQYNLIASLLGL
jgi:alkylation response protein AidB-like acyl-CoA dehydrogenase